MKDMISEIVNLDQKERELTEEAQNRKVVVQQEIAESKNKIKETYLTRARQRIKQNEETEKKAAAATWASIKRKQTRISKKLDKSFDEKSDEWVKTIVNNVIGE